MGEAGECGLPGLEEAARLVSRERTRGASWALLALARGLLEDVEEGRDPCRCLPRVRGLVYQASHAMAPPKWVYRAVEAACGRGGDPGEAIRGLLDYQSRSQELAAQWASRLIEQAGLVVTLSYSSMVERAIRALGPRRAPGVVVLESRPGGEGGLLAAELRRSGYTARAVPDLEAGGLLGRGVLVLLGADELRPGGCVVNKVGSRLLALAARRSGARVAVVLDATKANPEAECGRPPEVYWDYQVEWFGPVRARVFDEVEPGELSVVASEAGLLEPGPGAYELLVDRLLSQLGL